MNNVRELLLSGETFEFRLMALIRATFPNAAILHDLRLYSRFLDKETQIDVVVIDSSGVFVIEAKNWKFWIKGEYNDQRWSGLTSDRKVITVFNPYHQNFIHVRELRNAIRVHTGVNPIGFKNLVVLPDGTEIHSACKEVMNLSSLPDAMKKLSVPNSVNVQIYKELIGKSVRG